MQTWEHTGWLVATAQEASQIAQGGVARAQRCVWCQGIIWQESISFIAAEPHWNAVYEHTERMLHQNNIDLLASCCLGQYGRRADLNTLSWYKVVPLATTRGRGSYFERRPRGSCIKTDKAFIINTATILFDLIQTEEISITTCKSEGTNYRSVGGHKSVMGIYSDRGQMEARCIDMRDAVMCSS